MSTETAAAYQFEDAVQPKPGSGRQRETTPFDEIVGQLTVDSDQGKKFLCPLDKFDEVRAQLRSAGRLHNVTVRISTQDVGAPKGHVIVIFSTKTKVVRESKVPVKESK